ncbi:Methylmalonyl-CoA epimerase [[Clostridium] ultunense Esp]|nr:Methylmalonyl-CoA epimerase [[Clostridium] ultunense Esp]
MGEKIRVLVAKPGLDGHDRGALIIAQALRDAGMEVIYTGLRQTPAQIVKAAIQEDVDCIGLSSLSGAHNQLFPEVTRLLQEEGASDILVVGGGVIPDEDIPYLLEKGIAKIFTPGSSLQETVAFIRSEVEKRRRQGEAGKEDPIHPPSQIDHIGIAVKSITESRKIYEALGLFIVSEEEVAEEKVKVAMIPIGETRIELLEATSPDSPIAKFIEKRGEGIHHIALRTGEMEETLHRVEKANLIPIPPAPRTGAHGSQVAFLSPKSTYGVLIELVKPGEHHDQ